MAEATDRPQGGGEGVSAWPERVAATGAELDAEPKPPGESYRPLSLLALVGFGLAIAYALFVVLGGAISLFNNVPWLMPLWTFLVPAVVLILCWAARLRIRNAEGTLGGLAFTTWGLRLAGVVGLTYAACYIGFFLAVRHQAILCADQFFDQLKQGRPERAFLLAMGVASKDTDDAELRDLLEVRFNSPSGPGAAGGSFSQFRQSEYVRAIKTSGGELSIVPLGVLDWGYGQGGYRVVMKYQVSTLLTSFEMSIETFGRDSKPGEPKGRQWQVALQKGGTSVIASTIKLTPRGEDYRRHGMAAKNFATNWETKVNRQQWAEVYLDTLKPAERARLKKGRQTARLLGTAPVAGLGPLGLCDADCRDFLTDWPKLSQGKLIRIDDKTFWTSKRERAAILQQVERSFVPHAGQASFRLQLQNTQMPLSRTVDGEEVYLFDASLLYMDETGGRPKYVVNGEVAVAAPEDRLDGPPSIWRIQAIELSSGRTPPSERPRPGAGPG